MSPQAAISTDTRYVQGVAQGSQQGVAQGSQQGVAQGSQQGVAQGSQHGPQSSQQDQQVKKLPLIKSGSSNPLRSSSSIPVTSISSALLRTRSPPPGVGGHRSSRATCFHTNWTDLLTIYILWFLFIRVSCVSYNNNNLQTTELSIPTIR